MTKLSKRSKQSFYEKEGFRVMLARRLRTNVRLKIDLPKELAELLNKKQTAISRLEQRSNMSTRRSEHSLKHSVENWNLSPIFPMLPDHIKHLELDESADDANLA